ncbi:hypothetical protein BGX33_003279 [Mortierella sp. NVP41]|nr:hypothetical protein BGX33_003279 [Mortierella sp. NVP41]
MTTNRNSNIDTDYHLGLKLFRKIRCHCKKESALAKGSSPTTRHSASTSTKKEYFVMCTGRVYDKHSDYDIVAQPGSDSYYTYNIRSWIKRSGGFHQCKFQVPLQAAIFDYNLTPIHTRISITDWLSQWLSPPPSRSSFTTTTTRPGTDLATASTWLQRTNALLTTIRNPITDAKRPLLPPPSPYTLTPGPSSSGQTGGWGQVDSDARLDELDKVLQRAVAQHVQEVERVKGKLDSGRLIATTESETQEHHHKEIDMSTFPSVVMLPCNNCTDNHASDFCIVPRAKPILNTKTTIATTTTTVDVPTSVLIDVAGEDGSPPLDPLTELSNALDKADQPKGMAELPPSSLLSVSGAIKQTRSHPQHSAVMYDEVELWPRTSPPPSAAQSSLRNTTSSTTTTPTTTPSPTTIGANIKPSDLFRGLSPVHNRKVCGFHMHALEWHHMQTIEIDQILALAETTRCDYFNLSVSRWLLYRGSDKNQLTMTLFRKIGCLCKEDAVLIKTPPFPYKTHGRNEKQLMIVCRGSALADPLYEIVQSQPALVKEREPYYHTRQLNSKCQGGGGVGGVGGVGKACSFCIPLEIAIYKHHRIPIHSKVLTSEWLSQWFPASLTSSPISSSSFGATWARRTDRMVSIAHKGPVVAEVKRSSPSPSNIEQRYQPVAIESLDNELADAVGRHFAVVESILGIEAKPLSEREGDTRCHKEIDMEAHPSHPLLLCNKCNKDSGGEFCVVPLRRIAYPSPPPEQVNGSKEAALGQADMELERVMARHAEGMHRTLVSRAQLVPHFRGCESCGRRHGDKDKDKDEGDGGVAVVVPCWHVFLCHRCLDRILFYLVPRK